MRSGTLLSQFLRFFFNLLVLVLCQNALARELKIRLVGLVPKSIDIFKC